MSSERGYFSHVDAGRPVLGGHKQIKRKLVAPLANIPSTTHINTTADIFPQLLWIALLFERWGYHRAVRLAGPFRKALEACQGKRPWHLLSEIAKLTNAEWESLDESQGEFKQDIISAFVPLLVYPQLPLRFMRDQECDRGAAIKTLESCVGKHSNRFETPGAATIGTFVFLEAYAGRFQVPGNLLQGLSSIVDRPDSDEADMAASGARALMLAFWSATSDTETQWPSEFWRSNRDLSGCRVRMQDV